MLNIFLSCTKSPVHSTIFSYEFWKLPCCFYMAPTNNVWKQIRKMLENNGQLRYSKIIVKLCLLFGTAEPIALVQILNAERKSQSDVILNAIFGLLHIFLWSSGEFFQFVLFDWNVIHKKYRDHTNTFTWLTKIKVKIDR